MRPFRFALCWAVTNQCPLEAVVNGKFAPGTQYPKTCAIHVGSSFRMLTQISSQKKPERSVHFSLKVTAFWLFSFQSILQPTQSWRAAADPVLGKKKKECSAHLPQCARLICFKFGAIVKKTLRRWIFCRWYSFEIRHQVELLYCCTYFHTVSAQQNLHGR